MMELGRRIAAERELIKSPALRRECGVFDESSNFYLYPTLMGIKCVNVRTNKYVSLELVRPTYLRTGAWVLLPLALFCGSNALLCCHTAHRCCRIIGKGENLRSLTVALYQGV